jgi:hypothetical protein
MSRARAHTQTHTHKHTHTHTHTHTHIHSHTHTHTHTLPCPLHLHQIELQGHAVAGAGLVREGGGGGVCWVADIVNYLVRRERGGRQGHLQILHPQTCSRGSGRVVVIAAAVTTTAAQHRRVSVTIIAVPTPAQLNKVTVERVHGVGARLRLLTLLMPALPYW